MIDMKPDDPIEGMLIGQLMAANEAALAMYRKGWAQPPEYFQARTITNFPGRRGSDRILMWGTTSFCDELTDDFGGAFEATSIDVCRLFCRLAEI